MKQLTLFEKCRKTRMTLWFTLLVFGIAFFYAAVCTPIYIWGVSDILIADSAFPMIWDGVMLICNYSFYWVVFVFLFYMLFRFGFRNCGKIFVICGCVILFRYLANLLSGYLVTGFGESVASFWYDLPYMLLDVLFDCILICVFIWILYVKQRNYTYQTGQGSEVLLRSNLPFEGFSPLRNPVQRSLLLGAMIPAGAQMISRVIYDIFYGAPTGIVDLLWMIVSYASDIMFFFVGYIVMLLLVNRLFFSEEKARLADQGIFMEQK